MSKANQPALANILWIGGAPDGDKTTTAAHHIGLVIDEICSSLPGRVSNRSSSYGGLS